jgi:6,7-dimethyl-8-ribityllumazine synthase
MGLDGPDGGPIDATGMRIAIAVATFNRTVTDGLRRGAEDALVAAGATITTIEVPGAFELPLAAKKLAEAGWDAVVALGAVIMGETDHYEHIAHRASEGLMHVMLETGVPVAFGVLTAREHRHATDRAAPGPANKGAEAAVAAVQMVTVLRDLDGTGAPAR